MRYRIYEQKSNVTRRINFTGEPSEWRKLINVDNNYAVAAFVRGEWLLIHDDVFFNWEAAKKQNKEIKEIVDYVGILPF